MTRTIHLGIHSDLSVDGAIIVVKKIYMARRGKIFMDNARNFVGTKSKWKKFYKKIKYSDETLANNLI